MPLVANRSQESPRGQRVDRTTPGHKYSTDRWVSIKKQYAKEAYLSEVGRQVVHKQNNQRPLVQYPSAPIFVYQRHWYNYWLSSLIQLYYCPYPPFSSLPLVSFPSRLPPDIHEYQWFSPPVPLVLLREERV